jgi:PAS domain-containing protein
VASSQTTLEACGAATLAELASESPLLPLLSILPIAVAILGADGTILYWNDFATSVYGWTPSEALGKSSAKLLCTRLPVPKTVFEIDLMRLGSWNGSVSRVTRTHQRIEVCYRSLFIRRPNAMNVTQVEVSWNPVMCVRSAGGPKERSSSLETLQARIRALKAATLPLMKENEDLRRTIDEAAERERRRIRLLTQENADLRDVLTHVCARVAFDPS